MKTPFIFVVIYVFMASATRWYQNEPLYSDSNVKFSTYPSDFNHGGFSYGGLSNGPNYGIPFYLPYENSANQASVGHNAAIPLYDYPKKYQNYSYAYHSVASNAQKTGTGNAAFTIYGQPANPYSINPYSNKMYLPALKSDQNGPDLYIPSIDHVIKKLVLRLRNPGKKLIEIENSLNLRSSYVPYWDSIIDEFVENFFKTNPGLSNVFQSTDMLNIVPNFGNVIMSFTDFLKIRWGIQLLNSNERLKNLFNNLVNYKTTPENLSFLYKQEITQNYFNTHDHSFFHEADQPGTKLSNVQKIPVRLPPLQIPLINPNGIDKMDSQVGFNNQHLYKLKNEDLQNIAMNKEINQNYSPGLHDPWILNLPASMDKISDYDGDSNNYKENNGNSYNDLNQYPTENNDRNSLKNMCDTLAETFGDLITILNKPGIDKETDDIKRLFKIVRQFIYIYNLKNIPFGDTVTTIGKILLESDNVQANQMDIKIGLEILLNENKHGELGKLFEDVKYGRVNNLNIAIDRLGSLLYKYKQSLLLGGISETSTNLLLRIAIDKSQKILSNHFAEECKRKTSNDIWKSLYSVLNLKTVSGEIIS